MQLSTRGRYAVMAMVDLATRQTLGCECGPVCLAEIAARQKFSQAYLEQLFGKLRRAGWSPRRADRAAAIGWRAASDAIAIADIIAAVEEPMPGDSMRGQRRCQADDSVGGAGSTASGISCTA